MILSYETVKMLVYKAYTKIGQILCNCLLKGLHLMVTPIRLLLDKIYKLYNVTVFKKGISRRIDSANQMDEYDLLRLNMKYMNL